MNKLEDHIDTPIKKCVVGLALLGLRPLFSCCGFSYEGEIVQKTHMNNKAYVYLDLNDTVDIKYKSILLDVAKESSWLIRFIGPNCPIIDFTHADIWASDHPWKNEGSVHKYETPCLAINTLEKVLTSKRILMKDVHNIIDGNKIYKTEHKIKYWQYPSCEDWLVTKETFDSL